MMPRYVPKTYGRNPSKDTYASQAFDDLLHDKRGASTAKAAATAKAATMGSKWGKTSFTSTRTAVTPTPMEETETKKRKVESTAPIELFDDPFSFDDEGPKKALKTEKRASPLTVSQKPPRSLTKPVPVVKSSSAMVVDDDDYIPVKKHAIKTYGKATSKNGATKNVIKPLGLTTTVSKPLTESSNANHKKSTISIDMCNSQKMPVLTLSRDRLNRHNQQQTSNSQTLKKKFFVTSPTKSVDEDHNYSHKEESSNRSSSQDTKLFESDYEVDSEVELESGDPEITFNSPKKRARDVASHSVEKVDVPGPISDDNDTLPDEDVGQASPFSLSDDEDSLPSRSSTQRYEPAARYTASYSTSRHILTLTKANSTGTTVRQAPSSQSSTSNTSSTVLNERKPIFTYSRSKMREANSTNSQQQPGRSCGDYSRPSCSDLDQDGLVGRLKPDRFARADSPASVGSASSSTSTSSAAGKSLKLTYSRKSRSDPSKMGDSKQYVRKLLTSPKKSVAVYNPRPWSSDTDGQPQQGDEEPPTGSKPPHSGAIASAAMSTFDDLDADEEPRPTLTQPKFRRRITMPERVWPDQEPVSTLRVTREHKPLFTVVKNVKQAHECQEHGETQEFQDDIDYILDGLQGSQKETLRCLSTISLVSKSAMPAFRMHLRAHGTITKIYSALQDAPDYPTLALCTAGVMFMLSRDRLNMELDKPSLQLMLNLLSVDAKIPTESAAVADYNRMKKRIQAICESLNVDGKTRQFHLDLIDISPGKLAMESLLSLTSRKAGDWFNEELRELGGLDHIVSTVSKCSDSLDEVEIEPTSSMLNTLKKIDRCLRVLENVTMMNTENQNHLLHHNGSELTIAVCRALRVCENCQPFNPVELDMEGKLDKEATGYIVYSCMLAVLRVLLNITHDNEYGCRAVGQQSGMITTLLRCVLQVPQYITIEQRFDLLVLSLGLMINMIEHSDANRQILLEESTQGHYDSQNSSTQVPATIALTQFFVARFDAAERMEAEQAADHEQMKKDREKKPEAEGGEDADASGQWQESESGLEWVVIPEDERGGENGRNTIDMEDVLSQNSEDNIDLLPGAQEEDENFTKALHKAGRHMEDSIIAAYVSLLIGVILQNNTDLVDDIKEEIPSGSFEPMIKMLKKFLGFMNFTSSVSNGGKSILRVIHTLEAC